jgi:hypothetical protein
MALLISHQAFSGRRGRRGGRKLWPDAQVEPGPAGVRPSAQLLTLTQATATDVTTLSRSAPFSVRSNVFLEHHGAFYLREAPIPLCTNGWR